MDNLIFCSLQFLPPWRHGLQELSNVLQSKRHRMEAAFGGLLYSPVHLGIRVNTFVLKQRGLQSKCMCQTGGEKAIQI